jgi:hypothetical protein
LGCDAKDATSLKEARRNRAMIEPGSSGTPGNRLAGYEVFEAAAAEMRAEFEAAAVAAEKREEKLTNITDIPDGERFVIRWVESPRGRRGSKCPEWWFGIIRADGAERKTSLDAEHDDNGKLRLGGRDRMMRRLQELLDKHGPVRVTKVTARSVGSGRVYLLDPEPANLEAEPSVL